MDHLGREQVEDLIMKYGGKVRHVHYNRIVEIVKIDIRILLRRRMAVKTVFVSMLKYWYTCEYSLK